MANDVEHTERTQRSQYRYLFTGKHHGGGSLEDACWHGDLSREAEFTVFDNADLFQVSDEEGNLYGVLPGGERLLDLGTWGQQVAEFPFANPGVPWHGYPIWAVGHDAPGRSRSQRMKPSKQVFLILERAELISTRQRMRLWKGDHA